MILKSFTLNIFILTVLPVFISCSNSLKNTEAIEQTQTRATVIQVTPTPFLGKVAKIRGNYSPIKITGNLEDSVEQQELPKIWLEFDQKSGEFLKTELDSELEEKLSLYGKSLFHYQYVMNNSENPDERYDVSYKNSMTFINTLNEIEKMEIDSPNGKRRLTEEEAVELLFKPAGLINDRYYELDNNFKPKSSFYRFKKSVNEKLGYSIF